MIYDLKHQDTDIFITAVEVALVMSKLHTNNYKAKKIKLLINLSMYIISVRYIMACTFSCQTRVFLQYKLISLPVLTRYCVDYVHTWKMSIDTYNETYLYISLIQTMHNLIIFYAVSDICHYMFSDISRSCYKMF